MKKAGEDIVGTAQIIRTSEGDSEDGDSYDEKKEGRKEEGGKEVGEGKEGGFWIGCLFTSKHYGKKRDSPDTILTNTGKAMEMLLELVKKAEEGGEVVSEARMCKINSGKFGVEWGMTEGVLKGIEVRGRWRDGVGVWSLE